MSAKILIHAGRDELLRAAANRFVEIANQSTSERGRFLFSLAGGSTPKAFYELLSGDEYVSKIDWQNTLILFGDERAVSPDDELSNYRMAKASLFDRAPIPPENIHRMRGEIDLEEAAKKYGLLVQELGTTLDLCLLGMGPDGHTASLFPHTPELHEAKHRCVATGVASLEPHVRRLTLTFRTFNAARNVWLLVTGEDKAQRLSKVLSDSHDIDAQPVQGLAPEDGNLVWWLDRHAASLLPNGLLTNL